MISATESHPSNATSVKEIFRRLIQFASSGLAVTQTHLAYHNFISRFLFLIVSAQHQSIHQSINS